MLMDGGNVQSKRSIGREGERGAREFGKDLGAEYTCEVAEIKCVHMRIWSFAEEMGIPGMSPYMDVDTRYLRRWYAWNMPLVVVAVRKFGRVPCLPS